MSEYLYSVEDLYKELSEQSKLMKEIEVSIVTEFILKLRIKQRRLNRNGTSVYDTE
jgi:hypothetical protein